MSEHNDPAHKPPAEAGPYQRLTSIVAFELGLGAIALLIATWLSLDLGARWKIDLATLNWAVIATLPLVGLMLTLTQSDWRWVRILNEPIETYVRPMFGQLPRGSLILVALAAGTGEELLFRGVIQEGLTQWQGATLGLLLSSVLFGLAHALNRYYVLATFFVGLYLGLLYQFSQNIVLVILVHALYDWIVLRFLLFSRPRK